MPLTVKRCIIFSAAPIADYDHFPYERQPADLVIAADGGIFHTEKLNLLPDIVIGDMDSIKGQEVPPNSILFPMHKDDTDTMLAIKKGLKMGCEYFLLFGAMGGRFDHTMANVQALSYLLEHGANGCMIDETHKVMMVKNSSVSITDCYQYLSVFSYSTECKGVTLVGVEYPLDRVILTSSFPLGVSNHRIAEEARITVEQGTLLIILSNE